MLLNPYFTGSSIPCASFPSPPPVHPINRSNLLPTLLSDTGTLTSAHSVSELQVTPRDLSIVVSDRNFSFIWKQNDTPVRMLSYCSAQRCNMMMMEVFTCQPQMLRTQQTHSNTAAPEPQTWQDAPVSSMSE